MSVENLYAFAHRAHGIGGNYGLRKHRGDQSIDIELTTNGNVFSNILDQAAISQSAFDSACSSEWGTSYSGLSTADKADLRQSCIDLRSV